MLNRTGEWKGAVPGPGSCAEVQRSGVKVVWHVGLLARGWEVYELVFVMFNDKAQFGQLTFQSVVHNAQDVARSFSAGGGGSQVAIVHVELQAKGACNTHG